MDLEWNGNRSPILGRHFNEIIEIGAVLLDESLNYVKDFSALITPKFNHRVSSRVKTLTHISDADLRYARELPEVIDHFTDWLGEDDNCVVTFGTGDILVLLENFEVYGIESAMQFMKHYCDLQPLCAAAIETKFDFQLSLADTAGGLGIEFDELDQHRALDDSIISAECFAAAYSAETFSSFVYRADEEFFRRVTFKNYSLTDTENEAIEPPMLMSSCPVCGAYLKRTSAFRQKSSSIRAECFCGKCGKEYEVRLYFKMKYDGISKRVNAEEKTAAETETTVTAATATATATVT
jgi:inhibitor of KinA sporulation pathway (predicted exonuclease)